jgi:hypothetical protein
VLQWCGAGLAAYSHQTVTQLPIFSSH